ncbi:MAG: hypothetical protein ACR2QM_08735 [Longimicrobiales bacterium]
MKTRCWFGIPALAFLLGCGTPAPEAEGDGPEEAGDLITALINRDQSFAQGAASQGLAEATRAFVAADGLLFRPDPVDAALWLAEEHEEPSSIGWVPTAAALASSGDLGYTTGPFLAEVEGGQEVHGTYLTIWQVGQDGYRVVLDIATDGPDMGPLPEPADVTAAFEVVGVAPGAETGSAGDSAALESLKETDRGYAVAQATTGTSAALVAYAANTVRLHRAGSAPIVGSADEAASAGFADERPSTSPADGRISTSGTLGYVYGSVAVGGQADSGNYVRIWRRDPGAAWSLALELIDVASP